MIRKHEIKERVRQEIPFAIVGPSDSFIAKTAHLPIEDVVARFIAHEKKLKTSPFHYFCRGVAIDLCETYAKLQYKQCDVCSSFFDSQHGYRNRCSEKCWKAAKLRGKARLSASRRLYNPRDPEQYAIRHNISVDEAADTISKFCVSHRQVAYWIARGFTEDQAKLQVSTVQKQVSKRSVEYWKKKGHTESNAIELVSQIQKQCSAKRGAYNPESHWITKEYWIKRGFSLDDALVKVEEKKNKMAARISQIAASKTAQEKREDHPYCLEFYLKRGYSETEGIESIKEKIGKRSLGKFCSKISQEFCHRLALHFEDDSLYFQERNKEFGLWDHDTNRIYFYDFVNVSQRFVVEFHGNYWHAPDDPKDKCKENLMIKLGFRYFVIWENDYNKDKEQCVINLIGKIKQ